MSIFNNQAQCFLLEFSPKNASSLLPLEVLVLDSPLLTNNINTKNKQVNISVNILRII